MDARAIAASRIAARVWPIVVLLAAWQFWIVAERVPAIVAPPPAAVAVELAQNPGFYLQAAGTTLGVALLGLAIGTLFAVGFAVLVWLTPFAAGAMTFPALLVQSTPLVALLPVLARLLGYGEATVIAGAAAIVFLPTFVIVGAGLRRSPPGADGVFDALGSSRLTRLRYLALPAAIPSVLVALRIAAANSILAALTAEYLIGQFGLGRVFADAQSQFLTSRAWGASLVATLLSVGAYAFARRLEYLGKDFGS